MNHFDKVAKLLATENLTVVRAPVRTACFDTESRTLTLPQWKGMTPEIETMLIGHEVGHALYTTNEMLHASDDNRALHGYINVVEDARIERLMKDRYPGLRKDFNAGYKQLNDKDFFGAKKRDLSQLRLIDRINLYFKVGYTCGVRFNSEEIDFVRAAEKTQTPQDVVELAKKIYTYAKEQNKKNEEERAQQEEEYGKIDASGEGEEEDDFDYEYDNTSEYDEDDMMGSSSADDQEDDSEDEKQQQTTTSGAGYQGNDNSEDPLESETQRAFDKEMEDLADVNTRYVYYEMEHDYIQDVVIGYKRILDETTEADAYHDAEFNQEFNKYMSDTQRIVNYLVKEFEMKKSATHYKRAKISKVGSLDMKKVYAYKLKDDIFKRMMSLPEGKNHGMIFLLDWSGSMWQVLEDTIKQMIPLAEFCRRVQIPFQVFAFTSDYGQEYPYEYTVKLRADAKAGKPVVRTEEHNFRLFEFMNDKMSKSDFNKMCKRLIRGMQICKHYNLGGTPLNESLYYLIKYVPQFIKKNNIEKMTLVTLSDGDGHSNVHVQRQEYIDQPTGGYKTVGLRNFVRDSVTKKDYRIENYGSQQTQVWLQILKDRYAINNVGFYVCQNRARDLKDAISSNSSYSWSDAYSMIPKMRKSFKDQGFYSLDGTCRDEMFIIPSNKLQANDSDFEVGENMTTKQIAKVFSKSMKGSRTSRILLDRFVSRVA